MTAHALLRSTGDHGSFLLSSHPRNLMTSSSPPSPTEALPVLYSALRVLGLVVLALMCVSILYACWIAVANWGSIQV